MHEASENPVSAVLTIQDRWTAPSPPPLEPKDWVIEKDVMHPKIGMVRECYWDGITQSWIMDVTLYRANGERIGRASPAMGGPRSFEPALPVDHWDRIQDPSFPMKLDDTGYRDWRDAARVIPLRTTNN